MRGGVQRRQATIPAEVEGATAIPEQSSSWGTGGGLPEQRWASGPWVLCAPDVERLGAEGIGHIPLCLGAASIPKKKHLCCSIYELFKHLQSVKCDDAVCSSFCSRLVGSVLKWSHISYSVRGIVLLEDIYEFQVKQPEKGKLLRMKRKRKNSRMGQPKMIRNL